MTAADAPRSSSAASTALAEPALDLVPADKIRDVRLGIVGALLGLAGLVAGLLAYRRAAQPRP